IESAAEFLEGNRSDAAAVRVDFEGTGSGFRVGAAADGPGDDARRGHAAKVSAAAGRSGGFAGGVISGGHFVCAAALADPDAELPAQPAARLFWPGLHTLCFADSHAGGVATPAPTTVGRRI